VLRSRIPAHVPVLGVSATLDPQTLNWVRESAGFECDVEILRTSIDRPEIYLQVSCIQETEKSMLNLQSVLPLSANRFTDIPKTIIYMDSVAQICKAVELFQTWMRQLNYPSAASSWVASYFSDMAAADKHRIDINFA
jgi:superfamily II DNA helicase RecQ